MTVPWRFCQHVRRQARVSGRCPWHAGIHHLSHSDSGRSQVVAADPLLLISRSTGPSRSRIPGMTVRTLIAVAHIQCQCHDSHPYRASRLAASCSSNPRRQEARISSTPWLARASAMAGPCRWRRR